MFLNRIAQETTVGDLLRGRESDSKKCATQKIFCRGFLKATLAELDGFAVWAFQKTVERRTAHRLDGGFGGGKAELVQPTNRCVDIGNRNSKMISSRRAIVIVPMNQLDAEISEFDEDEMRAGRHVEFFLLFTTESSNIKIQ